MTNVKQTLWRLFRTLLGLAVGALVTSFIAAGLIGGSILNDSERNPNYWGLALTATLFVFLFALPVGLIGHIVLYVLKRRTLIYYAGLGTIGGALFAWVTQHDDPAFWPSLFIYSLWAGACAAVAWFIRRPDKDQAAMPDPASHF